MSNTNSSIKIEHIAITFIVVIFLVSILMPSNNKCNNNTETFDCVQDRPLSAFNLDLITRRMAGELSDMTTDIIVTPNIKGHDIERDINVIKMIVEDDNFAVDYLRKPLSELLYYFIQMGDSPFLATNPLDAHHEELEYMRCLIESYSSALEKTLTYQRKANCDHGYDPDVFRTVLTNYLVISLKQGAIAIYDMYDKKRGKIKKRLHTCDNDTNNQLRRLRTILGDNRFNVCGCNKEQDLHMNFDRSYCNCK